MNCRKWLILTSCRLCVRRVVRNLRNLSEFLLGCFLRLMKLSRIMERSSVQLRAWLSSLLSKVRKRLLDIRCVTFYVYAVRRTRTRSVAYVRVDHKFPMLRFVSSDAWLHLRFYCYRCLNLNVEIYSVHCCDRNWRHFCC